LLQKGRIYNAWHTVENYVIKVNKSITWLSLDQNK